MTERARQTAVLKVYFFVDHDGVVRADTWGTIPGSMGPYLVPIPAPDEVMAKVAAMTVEPGTPLRDPEGAR